MADNIFDAERDRRRTILAQQSVSNIVKTNPNLRGFLSRYEDAEVSRLKLLELQRLSDPRITQGQKKLLRGVIKGRRTMRGGKDKKKKKKEQEVSQEPVKSQTQVEVEAEERRAKVKQEERRLRQQDRFLELEDLKQQRDFVTADRDRQQRELQRQDTFVSGQNRIIADQQIADFNQAQENLRAGQRDIQFLQNRQLQQDRLDLQVREMNNQFETNREQRALEYRRIDADLERHRLDVERAAVERDGVVARADAELEGIRERVARDDAAQHRELQQAHDQFIEELRQRGQDNTANREVEQARIDHQRAVDAERAITDRELIQGFTSAIDALRHTQLPVEAQQTEGRGQVDEVISTTTGSTSSDDPRDPRPASEPPRADLSQVDAGLREVDADGNITEAGQLALEVESDSLSSSSGSGGTLQAAPERIQRLASIQAGRPTTPRSPAAQRAVERADPEDPLQEGERTPLRLRASPQRPDRFAQPADEELVANRLRGQRRVAPATAPEPELALSEGTSGSGSDIGSVPSEFERILRESPPAGLRTQEEQLPLAQRAVQAGAGGLAAVGQAAGGLVGGVVQGVGEQLPAASDVGAAVGRAGVRAVSGLGSAVYQGLRGSPRPGEQTGGRLDPEGQVVGLGREIPEGGAQP
jgi:hypothetical protein